MVTSPVRALLGTAFDMLPAAHCAFYDLPGTSLWTGTAQVWRSRHRTANLLCDIARLPAAGQDVPLSLTVTRGDRPDHWTRRFGQRRYASSFAAEGGLLVERMGLLTNLFRLSVVDRHLHLDLVGCRAIGVPLPGWLRPRCRAIETADDGALTFDIPIGMPGFGPVIHYSGRLLPAERQ